MQFTQVGVELGAGSTVFKVGLRPLGLQNIIFGTLRPCLVKVLRSFLFLFLVLSETYNDEMKSISILGTQNFVMSSPSIYHFLFYI